MGLFGIISGALNTIPVVGHVKGVIHYAVGDNEGGTIAMHSATRTTAVIGGGMAGVMAGPVGAVAGAISAGAAVDGMITAVDSVVNEEYRPHGQLEAWTNVFTGNDIKAGLTDAIITTTLDGLGGYGSSGIGKAVVKGTGKAIMKDTTKETAKQMLKQELKHMAFQGALALNAANEASKEKKRLRRQQQLKKVKLVFKAVKAMKKEPTKGGTEASHPKENDNSNQGGRGDQAGQNRKGNDNSNQGGHGGQAGENGKGNSSDEESDSGSSTDMDDISSSEESSIESSDDESSCQATKSNRRQCKRKATANGACKRRKHQTQMKRSKRRLPPLPKYKPFKIESLDDIKERNTTEIQTIIDQKLLNGPYGEPGYIYSYTVKGHHKIGCTERHPTQRMREQHRNEEKIKPIFWKSPCFQLVEFLIHKFLDFSRQHNPETNHQIEMFDVDRDTVERVCREIIKAIKKNMGKKNMEKKDIEKDIEKKKDQ